MKSRSIRVLATAAVSLLALSGTGYRSASLAVSCPNKCQDIGASGATHKFAEAGSNYKCEPNLCHSEEVTGTCHAYHDVCVVSFREAKSSIPMLEHVIAEGNEGAVTRLTQEFADAIRYNADREAIQVFGCDGAVIAHLPVPTRLAAALH